MKKIAYHLLRLCLAYTFIWIGVSIWRAPEAWGSVIQPWAMRLLVMPLRDVMLETAVLDIAVGMFLLVDVWTWIAALVGAFHLLVVLVTVGLDTVTIRDIGLAGATAALTLETLPSFITDRISWLKK